MCIAMENIGFTHHTYINKFVILQIEILSRTIKELRRTTVMSGTFYFLSFPAITNKIL